MRRAILLLTPILLLCACSSSSTLPAAGPKTRLTPLPDVATPPSPPTSELRVAPLRYGLLQPPSPSADADYRRTAPSSWQAEIDPLPSIPPVDAFELANGLHVMVVARPAFPMVVAHLVIASSSALFHDPGSYRAFVLARTYLSPLIPLPRTSSGCAMDGCFVASMGTSEELGVVIDRLASLIVPRGAERSESKRRLAAANAVLDQAGGRPFERMKRTLLFGTEGAYGQAPLPPQPTYEEVEALRAATFQPAACTLVVVGDATEATVRSEVERTFAHWGPSGKTTSPRPPAPPPLPEGPHSAFYRNNLAQVWASIAARGPRVADRDAPAFLVLSQLLGGMTDSAMFHHVREDLGASYALGAGLEVFGDLYVLGLTASFGRREFQDGLQGLAEVVARAREAEPSADDLNRAKAAILAGIRGWANTDGGLAGALANGWVVGQPLSVLRAEPARVQAVAGADVLAAARRYLAPSVLRLALMGGTEVALEAESMGFGAPASVDRFGQFTNR
ncbi:MAG TPA: insulinase family protein [Polyangiaceae bacterium]|nr:insulinase family protein [Polyangiaceae bacterium]